MRVTLIIILSIFGLIACKSEKGKYPYRDSVEEKIDVGGYKLNFKYTLGIEPVIVFESAGGNEADQWNNIQETLPYLLRNALVSYDREGHGESELSSTAMILRMKCKPCIMD